MCRDGLLNETKLTYRTEVCRADRDKVGRLVAATGFFSAEEIAIARELVEERLKQGESSGYFFLFAEEAKRLVAYACFGPIPGTLHSFDLYWIAVHPAGQGRGLGRSLLEAAEQTMVKKGAVRLYVDTSSRPQYEPTRRFYKACGYREAAFLEDFYAPQDGKVIFVKAL